MKMLRDEILVELTAATSVLPSGIELAGTNAVEKPREGVVAGVGPLITDALLVEGVRVLVSAYAGVDIERDDKTYLICREQGVLAIL